MHLVFRTTHLSGRTCLDIYPAKTIAILPNSLDFENFNCVEEPGFNSHDVELEQKQNNQHHDNDDENGAGHDDDIYIMMQCLFATFLFIPAPPPAPRPPPPSRVVMFG